MSKLFDDDFIEIDDSELISEGKDIKINIPDEIKTEESTKVEEKKEEVSDKETKVEDDPNMLEIPDGVLNPDSEDDEEQHVEDDDTTEETSEEETEEMSNEFAVFGNILAQKGFFPNVEQEELGTIESDDDLADLLGKQLNTTFSSWKDKYKENLVNNLIRDGLVSPEQVKTNVSYSEDQIKGNLDVAKDVIRKYYKRAGIPEKEIEVIIESREDLEGSALELNQLNIQAEQNEQTALAEKMKRMEEEQIQRKQNFTEALRQTTFDYDEFIPGKKLRKADKEEVFMNIEPVLQKINGDLAKYAPMLAYLDKYGILEGKFDKLIKTGKSQSVSDLERILKEKKRNSGNKTTVSRKSSSISLDNSDVPSIYK